MSTTSYVLATVLLVENVALIALDFRRFCRKATR